MGQYLSGADILEQYNLAPFQLGLLINKGAIPLSSQSGEPLPCLTEPESWLHDLNVMILKATALVLALYDTAERPACKSISQNSYLLLAGLVLRKLADISESWVHWDTQWRGRFKTQDIFAQIARLLSKRKPCPQINFVHTNALLDAARGDKNIWPILEAIEKSNHEWVDNNKSVYSKHLRNGYEDFLVWFFVEQTHGTLEHPLVREQLSELNKDIPKLLDFIRNYSEASVEMWSWNFSANILNQWEEAPNQYRLNSLLAIAKELGKDFRQTHSPWDNPINTNHIEEHLSTLQKSYFEKQHIEAICADIFESETHELPESIPNSPALPVPVTVVMETVNNKPADEEATHKTVVDSPPPLPTDQSDIAGWVKMYEWHRDRANNQDDHACWEMMILRLKDWNGHDIYQKLYPIKIKNVTRGTAKSHVSRTIKNRGVRLLTEAGLPVLPQLLPGKKGKW